MGHGTNEDLLARLLDKVASLEERVKELEGPTPAGLAEENGQDGAVSRRGLLKKVGAVAAAGVGLAAGASVLAEAPAGANAGDALILGQQNNSDKVTYLTGSMDVQNLSTGPAIVATTQGEQPGVFGSSLGDGVFGGGVTNGVHGQANGQSAQASGVYGHNTTSGYGVTGRSKAGTGVYGVLDTDRTNGRPAVQGYTIGSGPGVEGLSGGGTGVNGEGSRIGVSATGTQSGLYTVGGDGVVGICNSATGAGVRGSAAVGRGVRASGKLAQLQLVPSGATIHPSSGQAGDLFVDKSHRLWFCKGGTAWKQLA